MKILSIRIQNINSLKGDNFIDFNAYPLKDTGLFAITGPTGAGKSTILDAISLALYNYVPRNGKLSKSSISKYGAIITRGTKSCYAEIEYQVGEGIFRSKWSIGVARTGSLRDYDMEISKKDDKGVFNILDFKKGHVPAENARLIGLTDDQFMKSILLSQGEFTRFLKAKAKERSELLESITGTEIYRKIGLSAYAKNKLEKEKLDKIQDKLEHVDLLTDEELEEKILVKKNTIAELKILDNKEKENQKLLNIKNDILQNTKEKDVQLNESVRIKSLIDSNKSDFEKLHKHESLLHIKGDLLMFQDLELSIEGYIKKSDSLTKEIIKIDEESISLAGKYKQSSLELKSLGEGNKLSLVLFKKVREYDANIIVSSESYHEANKAQDKLLKTESLINKSAEDNAKHIDNLNKEIEQASKWINDNSLLEKAESDVLRANDKLVEMKSKFKSLNQDLAESENKEMSSFVLKNKICASQVFVQGKIQDTLTEKESLKAEMKLSLHKNKQEVSLQIENVNKELISIAQLKDIQTRYFLALEKEKNMSTNLDNLQLLKNKQYSLLEKISEQEQVLKLHIAELEIKNKRLELESNFDEHRNKLIKDKACPLCGSLDHPYHKSYSSQLSQVASMLKDKTKEYELVVKQQNLKNIECEKLQTSIFETKKQVAIISSDIKADAKLFYSSSLVINYKLNIDEKESLSNIDLKITKDNESLKKQYSIFENLELIESKYLFLKNLLLKINEIDSLNASTLSMLNKYSELIGEGVSSERIKALSKQYDKYMSAKVKLDLQDKEMIKLIENKHNFIDRLKETKESIQSDSKTLIEKNDALIEFKKARKLAFEDKNVDVEQEKLDKRYKLKTQEDTRNKELLEENKSDLKVKNESLKISTDSKNEAQLKKKSISDILNPKLSQLNYTRVEECLQSVLEDSLYKQIKLCFDGLTKKELENNNMHLVLTQKLNQLRLTDDSNILIADLENTLLDLKQQISLSNQILGSISESISKHNINVEKQKEVLNELSQQQKECDKWDRLNELIGDAKGDKYSKFAQELTLQQMLALANKHLLKLNKRYLLKYDSKRNEDLLIVDLLQGNDERSVRTLSGGESFLISLALALGLSDLAGQNTQIESLFIDEGFGTLDQETLDSALSTLETLQAESNRTIGIISHVAALKERIGTQIELDKNSQGYSTIKIR